MNICFFRCSGFTICPCNRECRKAVDCKIRVNLLYIFTLCRYGNSALGLLGKVCDRLCLGSTVFIRGYVIDLDGFGNDLGSVLSSFLNDLFLDLNGNTYVTDRFNFVTILVFKVDIKGDHAVILFAAVCQGAFCVLISSVVLRKNGRDQTDRNVKRVSVCFCGYHKSGYFRAVRNKFLPCRNFRFLSR